MTIQPTHPTDSQYKLGQRLHFRSFDHQLVTCYVLAVRKFLWWNIYLVKYVSDNVDFGYKETNTKWLREGRLLDI